jgi:hypothetical protein
LKPNQPPVFNQMQDSAFLDVDRHGVLRIPASLWVGFAVMARQWILIVVVLVSAKRSRESVLLLGDGGVPWQWLLMQAPIVILAFAAFYRMPSAGAWARVLWRNGRAIVALTAALNLVWTAWLFYGAETWSRWPELFLASCVLIDLAIALNVLRNPFMRQLFSEFPARASDSGARK